MCKSTRTDRLTLRTPSNQVEATCGFPQTGGPTIDPKYIMILVKKTQNGPLSWKPPPRTELMATCQAPDSLKEVYGSATRAQITGASWWVDGSSARFNASDFSALPLVQLMLPLRFSVRVLFCCCFLFQRLL